MNKIYFITGASGSGKTVTAKNIEQNKLLHVAFCYFDSVGVPSEDEMKNKFGGTDEWQKATISFWIKEIKSKYLDRKSVILDGQMRPSYITEECAKASISNYEIILFDCDDDERTKRLTERKQPELATEKMMSWAKYLREETEKIKGKIIDTTSLTKEESVNALCSLIE